MRTAALEGLYLGGSLNSQQGLRFLSDISGFSAARCRVVSFFCLLVLVPINNIATLFLLLLSHGIYKEETYPRHYLPMISANMCWEHFDMNLATPRKYHRFPLDNLDNLALSGLQSLSGDNAVPFFGTLKSDSKRSRLRWHPSVSQFPGFRSYLLNSRLIIYRRRKKKCIAILTRSLLLVLRLVRAYRKASIDSQEDSSQQRVFLSRLTSLRSSTERGLV